MKPVVKRYLHILIAGTVVTGLIHAGLWIYNHSLYESRKDLKNQMIKQVSGSHFYKVEKLRELRIKTEEGQESELYRYRWSDKEKEYVEIPIERAMDYYLHSLSQSPP